MPIDSNIVYELVLNDTKHCLIAHEATVPPEKLLTSSEFYDLLRTHFEPNLVDLTARIQFALDKYQELVAEKQRLEDCMKNAVTQVN